MPVSELHHYAGRHLLTHRAVCLGEPTHRRLSLSVVSQAEGVVKGDVEAERLDPGLEPLRLHSGIVTTLDLVGTEVFVIPMSPGLPVPEAACGGDPVSPG